MGQQLVVEVDTCDIHILMIELIRSMKDISVCIRGIDDMSFRVYLVYHNLKPQRIQYLNSCNKFELCLTIREYF